MKKLKQSTVVLCLIILTASCHFGRGKRTISVENNDFSLRIEYAGRITFTEDSTAVKSISPNGYLKFKVNGKKLEAENRGGRIVYSIDGDDETATITDHDKIFVVDAVHEMMRRGHYRY